MNIELPSQSHIGYLKVEELVDSFIKQFSQVGYLIHILFEWWDFKWVNENFWDAILSYGIENPPPPQLWKKNINELLNMFIYDQKRWFLVQQKISPFAQKSEIWGVQ